MFDPSKYSINLQKIQIGDIMSEVVVTVSHTTLASQAAHLMLRDRINGLPVLDDAKKVIGILTLADLFKVIDKAAMEPHHDFFKELFYGRQRKVSEIMTRDVHTVSPETTLGEVIGLTVDMKIHTFPVMKGDQLVGIIGKHDILNAVFAFY